MRRRRIAAGLGLAALLCANAAPVVKTDAGRVRGEALEGNAAAFHGIPFGAAPVGPLRWRDAKRVQPWRGVRAAEEYGPACPQRAEGNRPTLPQNEDCLNLNVITPDLKAKGLPVLVSIHGGAYAFGSNRYVTDQGLSPLLKQGIILVAPNYRVGRFGFFAHPALTAEAGRGTGNFWLSDQALALDWVKRNIARFGGDPKRVTILGCSAGGSSVNALMASPLTRGLFARASAHSGGGLFNANRPLAKAEEQGLAFAKRAGVEREGALARLRALDPDAILAADPGPPDYGAIVDGHWLPAPLSHTFAQGKQAPVPYIVGSTSNEASVFGLMGFDSAVLKSRFGVDLTMLRPLYEKAGPLSDVELLRRVQTDFIFTSAAMGMGGLAARAAPVWSYHFAHVPADQRATTPGAPHCADMPYLFGPLPDDSAEGRAIATRMQDWWGAFIRTGNPNTPGTRAWTRTVPGQASPMIITAQGRMTPGFLGDVLPFWYDKWQAESRMETRP
jgi:para-nitrobenzyl esterase